MNWQSILPEWVDANSVSDATIVVLIRQWRNYQLQQSDYTQLPDVPLVNKTDWTIYRQELRDLPSQGPDPKLWIFPIKP